MRYQKVKFLAFIIMRKCKFAVISETISDKAKPGQFSTLGGLLFARLLTLILWSHDLENLNLQLSKKP